MSKKEEVEQIINKNSNLKEILGFLKNKTFKTKYPKYKSHKDVKGYLIESKINEEEKIYIFQEPIKLKIYDGMKEYKIEVFSSIEINSYVESKDIDPSLLYIKTLKIKYITDIENLGLSFHLGNYELEVIRNKELPILEFKNVLEIDKDYTPNEYSAYFYKYFPLEDRNKKDKIMIYDFNETRNIITLNLKHLQTNKELKTFKFTGPTSIGKSFTLLRVCHVFYNFVYVNLKALKDENLYISYCMIISELERMDNVEEKELNELIIKNYRNNCSFLDLLLNIMDYLQNEDIKVVFVFDQFKYKYIKDGFLEKIDTFKNIKYVLCSSINDKDIRNFCLESWKKIGKNIQNLTINNQGYYLYYSSIYEFKKEKIRDVETNNIYEQLGFIPKYKMLLKSAKNQYEFLEDFKVHINKKIDEFCNNNEINKTELLINLKYIIKNEYNLNKLEEIIKYCLLKYFVIIFNSYTFKIRPIFPYILNIIAIKFTEEECDYYFQNELYKFNPIESESVKGDYFEEAVKFGIQRLQLPRKVMDVYTVDEIASMNQLIINKYMYNILSEGYIEENKNFKKENKNIEEGQNKIIYNIMEKKEENKSIKEKVNEIKDEENDYSKKEEYEYTEVDSEESSEEEDDDGKKEIKNDKNKEKDYKEIVIKGKKGKQNKNSGKIKGNKNNKKNKIEEFKMFLKNFGINIEANEKEENDFEGIDKESIILSKNIEYYRRKEIFNQITKLENINIKKDYKSTMQNPDFTGKESILIDQISNYGKTLDYALLYGMKNKKIFIGFKMKCYSGNSLLNKDVLDKSKIKDNCKKMLVNSMKLFNCKIMEWHYFLIFYCNDKYKDENIDIKHINNCQMNKIAYFFYNPILKKFFDSNIPQKRKEIKILKLTKESNLDYNIFNQKNVILEQDRILLNNVAIPVGENLIEMKESFIKDFSLLCENKKNPNIQDILQEIKVNMNIACEILFKIKIPFKKGYIIPPDEKHIFLYKKKNSNEYIGIKLNLNELEFYDVFHKNPSKYFCSLIDEDHKYYYCLSINRREEQKI